MKRVFKVICLAIFWMLLFVSGRSQSEVSLYDANGNAKAYISNDEDNTIYTWEGKPVAYLYNDGNDIQIYGFNGSHLGWYVDGVIRDHNGDITGFIRNAISNVTLNYSSYKGYKEYKPYKSYREYAPMKPLLNDKFSNTPLAIFLQMGLTDNGSQRKIFKSTPPVMETDLGLMERVVIQKQRQFDQNTTNVQNEINSIYNQIIDLYNYDSAYAASLLTSLKRYVDNLGEQPIDYSDQNNYNQVMNGLARYTRAMTVSNRSIERFKKIRSILYECNLLVNRLTAINPIIKKGVFQDYDSCNLLCNKGYSYMSNDENYTGAVTLVSDFKSRLMAAIQNSEADRYVFWTHKDKVIFCSSESLKEAIKRYYRNDNQ